MAAERKEREEEGKERGAKEISSKGRGFDAITSELPSCLTAIDNGFQTKIDLIFQDTISYMLSTLKNRSITSRELSRKDQDVIRTDVNNDAKIHAGQT